MCFVWALDTVFFGSDCSLSSYRTNALYLFICPEPRCYLWLFFFFMKDSKLFLKKALSDRKQVSLNVNLFSLERGLRWGEERSAGSGQGVRSGSVCGTVPDRCFHTGQARTVRPVSKSSRSCAEQAKERWVPRGRRSEETLDGTFWAFTGSDSRTPILNQNMMYSSTRHSQWL